MLVSEARVNASKAVTFQWRASADCLRCIILGTPMPVLEF